jgi:hypothetical protein
VFGCLYCLSLAKQWSVWMHRITFPSSLTSLRYFVEQVVGPQGKNVASTSLRTSASVGMNRCRARLVGDLAVVPLWSSSSPQAPHAASHAPKELLLCPLPWQRTRTLLGLMRIIPTFSLKKCLGMIKIQHSIFVARTHSSTENKTETVHCYCTLSLLTAVHKLFLWTLLICFFTI